MSTSNFAAAVAASSSEGNGLGQRPCLEAVLRMGQCRVLNGLGQKSAQCDCVRLRLCACACMHACVCVCVRVCMYLCVCVCVFVRVCIVLASVLFLLKHALRFANLAWLF